MDFLNFLCLFSSFNKMYNYGAPERTLLLSPRNWYYLWNIHTISEKSILSFRNWYYLFEIDTIFIKLVLSFRNWYYLFEIGTIFSKFWYYRFKIKIALLKALSTCWYIFWNFNWYDLSPTQNGRRRSEGWRPLRFNLP